MLVTKSKLAKNDAVAEYFRNTLPLALQKEIMRLPIPPANLDDWYKWAIQLQNNFIRMRAAIAKTQTRGGQTGQTRGYTAPNTRRPAGQAPRRFYFEPTRDPNAMDIDYMSTDKRTEMMRRGVCVFQMRETRTPSERPRVSPGKSTRRLHPAEETNGETKDDGKAVTRSRQDVDG